MIDMKKERKMIELRQKLDPYALYDGDIPHVETLLDEIEILRELLNDEINKRRDT